MANFSLSMSVIEYPIEGAGYPRIVILFLFRSLLILLFKMHLAILFH